MSFILLFLRKVVPFLFLALLAGHFLLLFHHRTNLTVFQFNHEKKDFAYFSTSKLLKGQKIAGSFTAQSNNLGIISVRFQTFGKINQDQIVFRLRQKGSSSTLFEHAYQVDQFQPDKLFTFGIPPQPNSQGKTYEFELESLSGTDSNSVALSSIDPPFATSYKFTKTQLKENPSLLGYLFLKNIPRIFQLLKDEKLTLLRYLTLIAVYTWAVHKLSAQKITSFIHFIQTIFTKIKGISFRKPPDLHTLVPDASHRTYPELDGLRGWAIISVIFAHLTLPALTVVGTQPNSKVLEFLLLVLEHFPFIGYYGGAMGVNLFFIMSGFLIFLSLSKKKEISFFSFMKRRYQRLLPVHVVSLIPLLAANQFIGLFGIFVNVFFLAEFFPSVLTANILTWTMSYEILFYVLCVLWLIFAKKNKKVLEWKYFFVTFVVLFLTNSYVTKFLAGWQIKFVDPNFFSSFFFGILIARIFLERSKIWKYLEGYGFPLGLGGLAIVSIYRFSWYDVIFLRVFGEIGVSLGYFFVNIGLSCIVISVLTHQDHAIKKLFRNKWLLLIGTISYSTYLTHLAYSLPLAARIVTIIPNAVIRLIALQGVAILVSLLIGFIFFYYLEKPSFETTDSKVK